MMFLPMPAGPLVSRSFLWRNCPHLLFCSFGLLLFCSFALCLWRTTGEDDRLVVLVPGIGHGKEIYSR
jgi:hypothetical protein